MSFSFENGNISYSPIEKLDVYEWENVEEDAFDDHGGNLKACKCQF